MTTTYPILKNPEYVDLQKTTVRVRLVYENGSESIAQFKVPTDKARGVNEYWDRILDEFDIEQMRKARNDAEIMRRRDIEFNDKKRKASIQSEALRQLFDRKMGIFNQPFMTNASKEDKAAVRRAPNDVLLNAVATTIVQKYIQDNGMSFVDLFDLIDDIEFETQAAVQMPSADTTSSDADTAQPDTAGESVEGDNTQ